MLSDAAIDRLIKVYSDSRLHDIFDDAGVEPHAIKYVATRWASTYTKRTRLKVSATPTQTWGTATYVTPIPYALSSALYGRIGLVTSFDPTGWRIFDATEQAAEAAYLDWIQRQPVFRELALTVHSSLANHVLRNKFRRKFEIDCVLFRPDQEAELHTDRRTHTWMAVTDWAHDNRGGPIDNSFSDRLGRARFTVLLDEEFELAPTSGHWLGLPIHRAFRQIERVTQPLHAAGQYANQGITAARSNPGLAASLVSLYAQDSFTHLYIEP